MILCEDCELDGEHVEATDEIRGVAVCHEHFRIRDNYEPPDPVDSDMFAKAGHE